ncbi:MAG TPA: nucleoside recognition domain-containing protein [Tepidisphaeraceae bacterium]|nr:nucleoside recognition domain-containing protein [Tepidisphaeraceae bacterium]
MLNYIWAGLIIFSFIFALGNDVKELRRDTYRNDQALPIMLEGPTTQPTQPVNVLIDPATYQQFYDVEETPAEQYEATLVNMGDGGRELRFAPSADLPPRLAKIRDMTSADDPKWLLAEVSELRDTADGTVAAAIRFRPVRWVSMQAISEAAMGMAKTAVTLAIGLIGTLAVFLGLMQIAEKAGLIHALVLVTGPMLRPLFPGIPRGHSAMGLVTLNLTANMLGLGNAATPFGIKAMEELQKLNKTTDTATNAMVMLLAMNTAGVQLLPPMMLYAVLGLRASELYFPILLVTGICLVIAVVVTRLLGMLPAYRASDPEQIAAPAPAAIVEVAR